MVHFVLWFSKYNGIINEFHTAMKTMIDAVATTGASSGRITLKKSRAGWQPSSIAASSKSRGTVLTNPLIRKIEKEVFSAVKTRITPR